MQLRPLLDYLKEVYTMKRYEKIKLEADEEVALEVIEQDGQIIIKAIPAKKRDEYFKKYAYAPIEVKCSKEEKDQLDIEAVFTKKNDYSCNYMNPPIPTGYTNGEMDL